MSLQIVAGKPGSGKSYHTITMLLRFFEDWSTFERKEGRPFDRVLYTNLPLQTEAINAYLTKKTGHETEIDHYIRPIDEDVRREFAASGGKFPLSVLPQNAMIVIDEVQKMFGSEMDSGSKDKTFQVEFRNYITTHRHHGHDLIFITQSTDNISKAILSQAEKLYEINNLKSAGLKFPINIPMADLDVVKEAFGNKSQFYCCKVGKYSGRRVKFDGEATRHVMTAEVFACYNSFTLSDVTSDRPSLNLTRCGAVFWLAKKHGWHLGLKLIVALFVLFWALHLIKNGPNILVKTLSNSLTPAAIQSPSNSDKTTTPKMSSAPPVVPGIPPSQIVQPVPMGHGCNDPNCTHDHSLPLPMPKSDEKITAVFPLGVVTDKGRRKIGQPIMIKGEEEIIKSISVRQGVVSFESGNKITVPQ